MYGDPAHVLLFLAQGAFWLLIVVWVVIGGAVAVRALRMLDGK